MGSARACTLHSMLRSALAHRCMHVYFEFVWYIVDEKLHTLTAFVFSLLSTPVPH